jgi:betaine-homocysteine S-methyltransferase
VADRPHRAPTLGERLEQGTVLCAEGYLFELERRGYVKSGPYVPEVVLDHPEAVAELHRELLRAGSDVMVAFTYYGHREKLRAIGREGDLEPLNREALRLARQVADEGNALVAGNICNTWVYDPADPEGSGALVREMYEEQVGWAADEGADLVLSETNDYLGEALIAVETIRAHGLPAVANLNSINGDETLDGVTLVEACRRLEAAGADVVGLNCGRGPETMLPLIEQIRAAVSCPVAAIPVPYRTTPERPWFQLLEGVDGRRAFPIALDPFVCTRFELADFAVRARDLGASFLGVCCGGGPHHVRAMAEALGRRVPASRYSPDLSLHPVIGESVKERDRRFVHFEG